MHIMIMVSTELEETLKAHSIIHVTCVTVWTRFSVNN